jgi:hypothetical protein
MEGKGTLALFSKKEGISSTRLSSSVSLPSARSFPSR